MRISTLRIQNFRTFSDEKISLKPYTCFVGTNGAGKSTVLAALNVFFREQSGATDVSRLSEEDFFQRNTVDPIIITVTFEDLSEDAASTLGAYVRQGQLTVSATAVFDPSTSTALVKHHGERLGFQAFREYFEAEKRGAKVPELTEIYERLRSALNDLPSERTKDARAEALRAYESQHQQDCELIASEDNFYGVAGAGKLSPYVQWVYVPAVKDVTDEGLESRNGALGKLIARAVRSKSNFDEDLDLLRSETLERYRELLERNQGNLTDIARALERRLSDWAHPNVRLGLEWLSDPAKSITVQQPIAGIKTGDGDFIGSLARMGHGLQRSYLLALLQELAASDDSAVPTLILGCEEPELYQHPPQARHLSSVLQELGESNNQILVTTHSPYFVSGNGFENVRLVQRTGANEASSVKAVSFDTLCEQLRHARGENSGRRIEGLIAKIHQALQPSIAEMFFARIPILVEGLEDVAYLTSQLILDGQWGEFRRLGCHFVPVHGKDKLLQPVATALSFSMPIFVVFDADSNVMKAEHRAHQERDNRALFRLLDDSIDTPFPDQDLWKENYVVWQTNMGIAVQQDFPADVYAIHTERARAHHAMEGGLEKSELFIADWLSSTHAEGHHSTRLRRLCGSILGAAKRN